jgi:hypothetical protein
MRRRTDEVKFCRSADGVRIACATHGDGPPTLMLPNAELGGTVPMWQWIGDEGATTFSF